MEHIRIGIVGNIGVGKSTLVKSACLEPLKEILLSTIPNRTGGETVSSFEEKFNPTVLDAFYENPVSKAFVAQVEFLNGRLDRQNQIEGCQGIVLEDRTIAEDYHIFGMAQKILGNMSEDEFLAYQRTYNLMTDKIPGPDLIVYLRADVSTLQQRIKDRGRESENTIPFEYLNLLNELYETYISRNAKCPVLEIDANIDTPMDEYLNNIVTKIRDEILNLKLKVTTPGISKWVKLPETVATLKAIDAETKLEKYLKNNAKIISIAGNVGLGKSTLTAIMQRSLKVGGVYENPEENPLLGKFLKNKSKYCYDLQLHFLRMRKENKIQGKDTEKTFILDRSLPEDLLVFCYQFFEDGYLNKDELDLLTTKFKEVSKQIPQDDLMIILKGSTELAWSRIQQRGREMEMEGGWSKNEIRSLNQWYKNYASDVVRFGFHGSHILEINVDKIDFTNQIHLGYIYENIYNYLTNQTD
jgi:deoxyadenosine/deoxycytidine kinase